MLIRPRRNRASAAIRGLVRETYLSVDQLVQPLFLLPDAGAKIEVASLPGTYRLGLDEQLREIENALALGIRSFIMFPAVPDAHKDKVATYSYADDNFYLQAARSIKAHFPDLCLISDVAMDPYSTDGHDGLVRQGRILNDETLPILARMGVAQAAAGFDLLGPSDMMDGRVKHLREALDAAGYTDTGIMSYTAKYASAYYGPFRDALDSAPREDEDVPRDKKTYQMDPANAREALLEATLDAAEGADYLMVKPALNYLDIIHRLRQHANLPIAAYHVSGECAMLLAAAQRGWLDFNRAMPETLLSIRRSGADVIITYFAQAYAKMVKQGDLA